MTGESVFSPTICSISVARMFYCVKGSHLHINQTGSSESQTKHSLFIRFQTTAVTRNLKLLGKGQVGATQFYQQKSINWFTARHRLTFSRAGNGHEVGTLLLIKHTQPTYIHTHQPVKVDSPLKTAKANRTSTNVNIRGKTVRPRGHNSKFQPGTVPEC